MSDVDVEIHIEIPTIINLLVNNAQFAEQVRLLLSKDVRGYGNNLGKWAQREPRPKFVQPNTTQRIY